MAGMGVPELSPAACFPQAPFCAAKRSILGLSARSGEKGSDPEAVGTPVFIQLVPMVY